MAYKSIGLASVLVFLLAMCDPAQASLLQEYRGSVRRTRSGGFGPLYRIGRPRPTGLSATTRLERYLERDGWAGVNAGAFSTARSPAIEEILLSAVLLRQLVVVAASALLTRLTTAFGENTVVRLAQTFAFSNNRDRPAEFRTVMNLAAQTPIRWCPSCMQYCLRWQLC